jgi:PAS domain-containing protein
MSTAEDNLRAEIAALKRQVADLKQTGEKSAENEKLLRATLDATPSRITVRNHDGQLLYGNKAFIERWNLTSESIAGKTVFDYARQ